jgi:hypothetical protein
MARPVRAALTVAALSPAALARSEHVQPLLAISRSSRLPLMTRLMRLTPRQGGGTLPSCDRRLGRMPSRYEPTVLRVDWSLPTRYCILGTEASRSDAPVRGFAFQRVTANGLRHCVPAGRCSGTVDLVEDRPQNPPQRSLPRAAPVRVSHPLGLDTLAAAVGVAGLDRRALKLLGAALGRWGRQLALVYAGDVRSA